MSLAHEAVLPKANKDVPLEYSRQDDVLKILGFWIFLATDLILFSCLFAEYQVMHTHVAGGPTESQLYDVPGFTAETLILLVSSFTCGVGAREMRRGHRGAVIGWLIVTMLLGASFIYLELGEFIRYATSGATLQRSGFLSSFFILVGTHGCHVSFGILWMLSILYQLARRGITPITARKVFIIGVYWHFLDIVWVFIFTVVYLQGVM